MDSQNMNVLQHVLIDVISFSLIGIFNIFITHFLEPFRRGFFCNDESIRYPHHDSTVPSLWLNICGIVVPITLILFFELKNAKNKNSKIVYRLGSFKFKLHHWNVYKMIICYGSGAIFCLLLTDVGKKTIGRLRPNFIDVCKPINLAALCSKNSVSYIENYTCDTSNDIVNESRVSFPSGHTSFSFYVAVFIILYLEKRLKCKSLLIKPVLQFLFLLLAWFVALSRVMNNKHHWSDVAAGLIIGSGTAIINTVILHKIFESDSKQYLDSDNHSNNVVVHEAPNQV